mgnify:CR=1 FL=1
MSKWASDKKQKMLFENWRKYSSGEQVNEREIPNFDPGEFPNPLPGDQSKSFMGKGWDDSPEDNKSDSDKSDDAVDVEIGGGASASDLLPSQNAIFLGKALGMSMVPKLSQGGDIGAVISEDNHILDGHHRWAATMLRSAGAPNITGTKIMLPITQLIPVLRAVGDALGNQRKGEPPGGDINIFSKDALNVEVLKAMVEQGKFMNPEFYNRDKLVQHLEGVIGGYDNLLERVKMIQAAGQKSYGGKGVAGAPGRLQMPVIDPKKGQDKKTATRLKKGMIDVAPPYGDLETGKAAYGGEDLEARRSKMAKSVSEGQQPRVRFAVKRNK